MSEVNLPGDPGPGCIACSWYGQKVYKYCAKCEALLAEAGVRYSLSAVKGSRLARKQLEGRRVRIWSDEWRAWWLPGGNGYTDKTEQAGVYDFDDAFNRTRHCDPEKKIVYVVAD